MLKNAVSEKPSPRSTLGALKRARRVRYRAVRGLIAGIASREGVSLGSTIVLAPSVRISDDKELASMKESNTARAAVRVAESILERFKMSWRGVMWGRQSRNIYTSEFSVERERREFTNAHGNFKREPSRAE